MSNIYQSFYIKKAPVSAHIHAACSRRQTYTRPCTDTVTFSEDVGIPSKLEALKEEDLPFLAESAAADACAPGNPKDATIEDFKALFRKLM